MSHLQPVPDSTDLGHPELDLAGVADPAAERAVLGSVLLAPKVLADVHEEGLQGDDFHAPRHETIWHAIAGLADNGHAVDVVTVAHALTESGELKRVGGPAYLHTLIEGVTTPANVGYYAQIVVDRANRRRLAAAGRRITQLGEATDGGATDELIEAAVAEVDRVSNRRHGRITHEIGDAIDAAFDALENGIQYVPSGLPDLDDVILGWSPGTLVTIGARPSVGKSAVMLQAITEAIKRGEPAGFTSLEMTQTDLVHRAWSNLSNVPYGHIRRSPNPELTEPEYRAVARASAVLRASGPTGHPLFALSDRKSGVTVAQIRNDIKEHTRKHGRPPTVWAVDYAQLVSAPHASSKDRNREQEVAQVVRGLKTTAMALETCIIVGSQLNRDGATAPRMETLRESGSVEQDSDIVILLDRVTDPAKGVDMTEMTFIVAKNRAGQTASVPVTFEGAFQRISGRNWRPSQAGRGEGWS